MSNYWGPLLYLSDIADGWGSDNWSQIDGVILTSEVREYTVKKSVHYDDGRQSTTSEPEYEPSMLYRYSVGDVEMQGYRIAIGNSGYSDRAQAQIIVDKYPQGEDIQVYYDPDNPESSLLEPGLPSFPWGGIFSSLLLIGIGFLTYKVISKLEL